jgi:hypothetical protein
MFTLECFMKITKVGKMIGLLFSTVCASYVSILTKKSGWASIRAILSLSHLVTLILELTGYHRHSGSSKN